MGDVVDNLRAVLTLIAILPHARSEEKVLKEQRMFIRHVFRNFGELQNSIWRYPKDGTLHATENAHARFKEAPEEKKKTENEEIEKKAKLKGKKKWYVLEEESK